MSELDPIALSRWQGKVDQRLENLDSSVGELKTTVDELPDRIEARVEKIFNGSKKNNPAAATLPQGVVTFKDLFLKLALPIVLALLTGAIVLMYKLIYDYMISIGTV